MCLNQIHTLTSLPFNKILHFRVKKTRSTVHGDVLVLILLVSWCIYALNIQVPGSSRNKTMTVLELQACSPLFEIEDWTPCLRSKTVSNLVQLSTVCATKENLRTNILNKDTQHDNHRTYLRNWCNGPSMFNRKSKFRDF